MKNKFGFYISEIRLEGPSVEPAVLQLKKGCNVISGASDTGKSYLFECIDFMFGAKNPPKKNITEGRGYDSLLMEIRTFDGKETITLMRELNKAGLTKKTCSIDDFWDDLGGEVEMLSTQHSANNEKTISALLLGLTGFDEEKKISKNNLNQKRTLSFRDVVHLTMVDEMNIITDRSPVLTTNYATATAEKCVLGLFLTGDDSSELIQIEDVKKSKANLRVQLDLVKQMIFDLSEKLEPLSKKNIHDYGAAFEDKIRGLTNQFKKIDEQLAGIVSRREESWKEIQEFHARIKTIDELVSRFSLLKSHYETDLDRLEFLTEGEHYLSQLRPVRCNCPVCGSELASKLDNSMGSEVAVAMSAEKFKINSNLSDLSGTVEGMLKEKDAVLELLKKSESLLSNYEQEIEQNLSPFRISLERELEKLLQQQKDTVALQAIKRQIDGLYEKQTELDNTLKEKKAVAGSKGGGNYSYFKDLSGEIETILKSWNHIKDEVVGFDTVDAFDIEIATKPRGSFGKGVRAILYTAFITGLMKYCIAKGLPHPRMLVIDSPLTPFKDKDSHNAEEINAEVQKSFFEYVAQTPEDQQIVIFENKVPDEKLNDKINHIHFSGRRGIGRQGFIPLKKEEAE